MDVEALRLEHYNATLTSVRHVNAGLAVLRVRPDAPKAAIEAGQWTFVGVGLWEPRCAGCPTDDLVPDEASQLQRTVFSLSGSMVPAHEDRLFRDGEEDWYEFYVALDRTQAAGKTGAAVAARLFAMQPGSRLFVSDTPQGKNTLHGVQPHEDVIFLATGTGEAPHNRMIYELLRREHRGRVASLVTVRHPGELAYRDEHRRLMQMFDRYRWHGVATRAAARPGPRLQAMLESGALAEHLGVALDPKRCHVFLCGNSGMVGRPRIDAAGVKTYPQPPGMIELLERRGFRAEPLASANVHFERS